MKCTLRKYLNYFQISIVLICSSVAISITIWSHTLIYKNNYDINISGTTRMKSLELDLLASKLVFKIPSLRNNSYIMITNKLLEIQNILENLKKDYSISDSPSITLEQLSKTNTHYYTMVNEFYKNLTYNSNDFETDSYRGSNYARFGNILKYYQVNISIVINKVLLNKLEIVVNDVVDESTKKSNLIIFITIGLGCIEIIGLIIIIYSSYKDEKKNIKLAKSDTEKNIQTKLVNMLSHDLKGSAVNIVGEVELLLEK